MNTNRRHFPNPMTLFRMPYKTMENRSDAVAETIPLLATLKALQTEMTQLTVALQSLLQESNQVRSLFIKVNAQLIHLHFNDILYVEACGDYVHLYTENGRFTIHKTMKKMTEKLPTPEFIRVHRSFIVRRDKIQSIEESMIIMGNKFIPVGELYCNRLMTMLSIL